LIIIFYYLLLISLLAIIFTIIDKKRAINLQWRIPEKTLLLIAILGGSIAMYITMNLIRHKTKHIKFYLGLPLIIVTQVIIIILIYRKIFVY